MTSKEGMVCLKECMKMVRNTRLKETPKKVKGLSVTYEGRVANCPSCNQFITERENKKRCPECGQKLDWSNE